jgi:hypothetical protein
MMKLDKRKKYLVKQGRNFPLIARYYGKHLNENTGKMMHLFLFTAAPDSGLFFDDRLRGVEEYSRKRVAEIEAAAEKWLARQGGR